MPTLPPGNVQPPQQKLPERTEAAVPVRVITANIVDVRPGELETVPVNLGPTSPPEVNNSVPPAQLAAPQPSDAP
jgi:hypothetical protein